MKTTSLGAVRAIAGRSSGGYIAAVAVVFMAIFLTVSTAMVNSVSSYSKAQQVTTASTQALQIAEAGIDKAFYALNNQTGYTGETATPFGEGEFTVSITSLGSDEKLIISTGYVPSAANPVSSRTVKAKANVGNSVISFQYAVQAGSGGFDLSGGATVNGSIYANGDIKAVTGVTITGSATAANPPAVSADQVNDNPATPPSSITFGNANGTQDFAQSFKISAAVPINSVQLYIRKNGTSNPSDATVRIVADNNGSPSGTTLLQGTLSANSVSTSYGWVTVTMPSTPVLSPSTTYWLVIDASTNASRYYILGANDNGYANGVAKVGSMSSGSWTASSLDGYFKIFLGGGTSMIGGDTWVGGVNIGGEAWANFVKGANVTGPLYCQTSQATNKACNTSRSDPTPQPMPLTDANIQEWKDAANKGVINGNYTVGWEGATLGETKINGNLTIGGGGTLTLTGPLWVTGNVSIAGGGKVQLSPQHGQKSGVIVTDGTISLGGGAQFYGSGEEGSYVFLVTTSACPAAAGCNGNNAINLSGGASTVALIAQNGTAQVNGGSNLKQITAQRIVMAGGAQLVYDGGLISETFHSSGPGGSWQFVPGSYVIVD